MIKSRAFIKLLILLISFSVKGVGFSNQLSYIKLNENFVLNSRKYLQIEKYNKNYKVLELEQVRGDYALIQKVRQFSAVETLNHFISTKYGKSMIIDSVNTLEDWPIDDNISDARFGHSKGLFSRRQRNKSIWDVKDQWSQEWELRYAQWIQENIKDNFFVKYNISTDCADAVLGIRWIFARIHGLPVANHISTTRSLFTNYSVPRDWRYISKAESWYEDKLFLTALNHVMRLASTRTIKLDSYPVALTKMGLRVGAFLLTESESSNHVKIISENYYDDPTELPIYTLASTVPRKVRYLVREVVTDQGWPRRGVKTFLKFRWPVINNSGVYLREESAHKDYSQEQFDELLKEGEPVFIKFLLGRLKNTYDPAKLITMALDDIGEYIKQRIKVVEEGYEFCRVNNCAPGTANWESWSTPSRDKKLKAKYKNIDLLTSQFEAISPGLVEKWKTAQVDTKVSILQYQLSLKSIRYLLESGKASSEPSDSIEKRWGIDLEGNAKEIVVDIINLLTKRKEKISSQWEVCSKEDCFPKTNKWLSWNTFKLDEQLLEKYTDLQEVCRIFGSDTCIDLVFEEDQIFDSGVEVLSLREWYDRIPYFYSNLDVSLERKWGKVKESGAVLLGFESSLSFSNNGFALIDSKILKKFNQKYNVYSANSNEKLFLSDFGDILSVDMDDKKYRVASLDDIRALNFIELEMSDSLLNKKLIIKNFSSNKDKLFLEYMLPNSVQPLLMIFSRNGELIQGPAEVRSQNALLLLPAKKELISVKNNRVFDLKDVLSNYLSNGKYLVPKYLTPISLSSDDKRFLFNYYDVDFGVQYPVLIDCGEVISLGLDSTRNIILNNFDLELGYLFLTNYVSEEYPKSYLATIDNGDVSLELQGNTFYQVVKNENDIYFATLEGSVWDQGIKPQFKVLKDGTVSVLEKLADYDISHFGQNGIFYNGRDVYQAGAYTTYDSTYDNTNVIYPSFINPANRHCDNIISNQIGHVEQMSHQHGDYKCFATIYLDESKKSPLFTQKLRFNGLSPQNIEGREHSILEVIGKNSIIWWK
jgi:hypothetical protein